MTHVYSQKWRMERLYVNMKFKKQYETNGIGSPLGFTQRTRVLHNRLQIREMIGNYTLPEGMREEQKDIERAFRVLQSKFHIIVILS